MIIYKIENRITGSVYIGKTNNFTRRMIEHKSNAFNSKSLEYDKLLYKKLREYGLENFEFSIIEYCKDEEWQKREEYWILYYNSFKGKGYNESKGGDGVAIESILQLEVNDIIDLLQNSQLNQYEIAKIYTVSDSMISNINNGLLLKQNNIEYPIRQNLLSNDILYKLKDLLENTTYSFNEISIKLNIAESTVKKINYGQIKHQEIFTSVPVRKLSGVKQKADIVKNLLMETDLKFNEIAQLSNTSLRTVGRINNGETHKDETLNYPLRNPQPCND